MTVEQFFGHVAVIIEVTHVGGGQPQQLSLRAESQQLLCALAPKFCANSMKLIQYNVGGVLFCYLVKLLRRTAHKLGVGVEMYILQRKVRVLVQ